MALPSPAASRIRLQYWPLATPAVDAGALDRVPAVVFWGAILPVAGITGKDKALEALNAKIAQLKTCCRWKNSPGSTSPTSLRRHARDCHR